MEISKKIKTLVLPILIAGLATPFAAQAYEKGTWLIRSGISTVAPDESSSNVFVGGTDLGTGVSVADDTQLGLNFVYFLSPKWAVEVLASTPFSHDIQLTGVKLLDSKQLPPTVTVNYFFNDSRSKFQPYVGVGLNYTLFFDENFVSSARDAGFSSLDLDDSFGLAAQVGFDYQVNDKWLMNLSARWIDISTDASFELNGDEGSVSVDVDPLVYTASLGYRF